MCAHPETLGKLMATIYSNSLNTLGFNKNVHKELRTAHARYQGMGMFDLNHSCMEYKVHLMREY